MENWSNRNRSEFVMSVRGKTIDKSERYAWEIMDKPGELMWIPKRELKINHKYQRPPNGQKITLITKEFYWVGLATLTVARRHGKYWVIDGQHRLEAVQRLSKIGDVPCIVFEMENIREEAFAFLLANAGRKPVTAIEKHAAALCSGDPIAVFVQKEIDSNTLVIKKHATAGTIACLSLCYRLSKIDKSAFSSVLKLCTRICNGSEMSVSEKLLHALWFVNSRSVDGLGCDRLVERICKVGAQRLLDAANRASAFYKKGGETVWGKAIMEEINSNIPKKFKLKGDA